MANYRTIFFIGVVGGLVGYACGAMFTPTRAVAQQINPADAGPAPGDPPSPIQDAGIPAVPSAAPPQACHQWEVKLGPQMYTQNGAVQMDEGWEPFAYNGGSLHVVLRRCVR